MTRHESENRLISCGSTRRVKQHAVFSGDALTADLTVLANSIFMLRNGEIYAQNEAHF